VLGSTGGVVGVTAPCGHVAGGGCASVVAPWVCMSPVVAVPVLRRRVGVSVNVAGVCMSPVVCVSCVLCRKCGWLSGQTYTLLLYHHVSLFKRSIMNILLVNICLA
jgi:hypothetical protein